jgi:hypothetical protein
MPLVGMQRYFNNEDTYNTAEVQRVCRFLAEPGQQRFVWAVSDNGPGLSSDARKHGEFDDGRSETNIMLHVCHALSPRSRTWITHPSPHQPTGPTINTTWQTTYVSGKASHP